jgi:hypothetical protein
MSSSGRFNWINSVPALVALALAGVYALGAASAISQLNAADLDAAQVMPLIPIEQILARGIGGFATVAVLALPVGLLVGLAIFQLENILPWGRIPAPKPPAMTPGSFPLSTSWPAVILLGGAVLFAPSDYAVILVFSGIAMLVAIDAVRNEMQRRGGKRWRPAAFLAGYFCFVLVATLMSSIVRPNPLPDAVVELSNGSTVRGSLVASSGNNWHIAREGEVITVSGDKAERVKITYLDRGNTPSLVGRIAG